MHRSRLFGGTLLLVVLMLLSGCRPAQDEGASDPDNNENNGGEQTSVLPITPAEPADWEMDPQSPDEIIVDLEPWRITAPGAPEDCIFFASSIGLPQKNAESEWPAERFLATPSVGTFFDRVQEVLLANAFGRFDYSSANTSEEEQRLIELFEILIERPATAYVTETAPVPTDQETVLLWKRAGLIVDLGEHADLATASLEVLLNILYEDIVEEGVVNDIAGYTIQTPNNIFAFACVHEGRLLFAVGENELEQLLARLDEAIVPEFVGHTLAESDIPKPLTVARLDVGAIIESPEHLEMFVSAYALPEFNFGTTLAGVRDAETVSHVTGLGSLGLRTKTVLKTSGENEGVIDNVFTEPLTADDLRRVPADAAIVLAVKGDASGVENALREGAKAVFPDNEDAAMVLIEELTGQWNRDFFGPMQSDIDIEELMPTLGPTWIAYGTLPLDEPGLTPEFLIYNELKDQEAFRAVFERVAAHLCDTPNQEGGNPSFTRPRICGEEMLNISIPVAGSFLRFNICAGILDGCFIVSTNQRAVEVFHERDADSATSFADNPFAAEAVAGPTPASVLTYIETASVFELYYPLLPTTPTIIRFAQPSLLEYLAVRIWVAAVPSLPPGEDVEEYMTPISFSASRTDDGVEIVGYYATPCGMAALRRSPAMIPPMNDIVSRMRAANNIQRLSQAVHDFHDANALLPPTTPKLPPFLLRSQSINNLKQIALAMHNYHDANKHFPAAYSSDASGELPLLSWRVHILPFIEESPLYDEFHLDEPWDSPHNATLIERMPDTYRSPGSTPEPGKTRYQTVRWEGGPFSEETADATQESAASFASIKDGTSNTILTVETDDERAVIWTQPDDFVPTPDNLMDGLYQDEQGKITTGLCDGTVHLLPSDLPADIFLNLIIMNDQIAIDWDEIQ